MNKENLQVKAKQVLDANFNEDKGFTIPCEGLYPFQWNWDSGFIAIGFAHYDSNKAKREIEALLSAQWENGFILSPTKPGLGIELDWDFIENSTFKKY